MPAAKESFADMQFPAKGIDLGMAFSAQREGTTPVGLNVRTFEPGSNRARGGQRPGLSRYLAARPAGNSLIQELLCLVTVSSPGGSVQANSSGRVVTLVAISQGNVYTVNAGDTTWSTPVNSSAHTPPLNSSGVVRSAANNQKLWFADGTHYCYFDPSLNHILDWTASAGTLPGHNGDLPRLIATWRGRTVLSGILSDPQNWFMSAVSDPRNWDYAPFNISGAEAVAGNNSPLGLIGDVVTALIPYSDDVLIMGGDHTIYQCNGDPASGGSIGLVTDSIGMAWGCPWCKAPDGTLYFVSNRTGIYAMMPGQKPQRISGPIDQLLYNIDTGLNTIRLIWDDRFQGMHIFITKTAQAAAATHFFFEQRTGAWWEDSFADSNFNPVCCTVFDGNLASDRFTLIGSWDGYVRSIDPTAGDDDGKAIVSEVVLGPILTREMDQMLLKDLQCLMAVGSGTVKYAVYVGATAEIALSSEPVASGTWDAGRNLSNLVRRSGHAVWVKITATNPWALEQIRGRITTKGKVQRRGR